MPPKDKGQRTEYNREYWQRYYKLNKEKILAKNTAWGKSEKGKECRRQYGRKKNENEMPDT